MKFGSHSYLFTDRWSDNCLHMLDTAKELGLDCFEIAVGDDVHFSSALTRKHARKLGLDLVISPGGLWPLECDLSSEDTSEREKGLVWHKKQVDLAGELGAVAYCGSMYGHTGVVKRRRPPVDEYKWVTEGLNKLAEYGKEKEVTIVLEPMSHFRTHLVNTPQQVMRLITLTDYSNLYALMDTYHMVTEIRDYSAGIKTIGNRLWGMHACENDRGVPGGGLVPWDSIFETLISINFNGYIILEAYNSSLNDFAYQRGMFHNVCPDPLTFVTQGIKFLKKGLKKNSSKFTDNKGELGW